MPLDMSRSGMGIFAPMIAISWVLGNGSFIPGSATLWSLK
ncbi:putative membrane protein [Enterobacter hormaechei]|nr:putative membrane protein [Enterobacter hormaechei]